eukprot:3272621-Pyramimonas_sp.AAC.1
MDTMGGGRPSWGPRARGPHNAQQLRGSQRGDERGWVIEDNEWEDGGWEEEGVGWEGDREAYRKLDNALKENSEMKTTILTLGSR